MISAPDSETIYPDALLEPGFEEVRRRAPWPAAEGEKEKAGPESVRFQGMRIAYFVSSLSIFLCYLVKVEGVPDMFTSYRPWTRTRQMTMSF